MTTENETNSEIKINSKLPRKELLALSKRLDERNYQKAYFHHKQHSVFLNPVAPPGTRSTCNIFDFDGVKRLYEQYMTKEYFIHEQGYKIPEGIIQHLEYELRQMFRRNEKAFKHEGKPLDSMPQNPSPRDIAELSARLVIAIEESKKMEKQIKEHETADSERKEAKRRSTRIGSVQRSHGDGVITHVDGMTVTSNGLIPEMDNQLVTEYLEEIRTEKARKRAARIAAQENITN